MAQDRSVLLRVDRAVRLAENAAAVFLVAGLVAVVTAQVVFRYFLAQPLSWSQEIAEAFLTWVTLLGMAVAQRDHAHIAMHLFAWYEEKFAIRLTAWLAMVLLFGTLGVGGVEIIAQHGFEESAILRVPYWQMALILPICSLLGLWHLFIDAPWLPRKTE